MKKQKINDEVNKNLTKEQKEGIKYGIDSKYAELEAQLAECIGNPATSQPVMIKTESEPVNDAYSAVIQQDTPKKDKKKKIKRAKTATVAKTPTAAPKPVETPSTKPTASKQEVRSPEAVKTPKDFNDGVKKASKASKPKEIKKDQFSKTISSATNLPR